MRLRDLALVGAVVLLAGFALADALREDDPNGRRSAPGPATAVGRTGSGNEPRDLFPVVSARGSLAFASGRDCRLREVSVATGNELPLPSIKTSCRLWAPPVGDRLAYGVVRPGIGATGRVRFRFLDVGRPPDNLGAYEGYGGPVWSRDGRRAAWCDSPGSGYDLALGSAPRVLTFCPRAYTPTGQLAHSSGRGLAVEERAVLVADGHITDLRWGRDGSLALLLDAGFVERRVDGRLIRRTALPRTLAGHRLIFSPDNCAALVPARMIVTLLDLGCFRGNGSFTNISPDNCLNRRKVTVSDCARFPAPRSFPGIDAAWSPDGRWIAVAELEAIAFHRVVGRYEVVRWETPASALAWR